jgi:hypothetical protein
MHKSEAYDSHDALNVNITTIIIFVDIKKKEVANTKEVNFFWAVVAGEHLLGKCGSKVDV